MFGIGDPLLLDRRAVALAEGVAVPLEALDLALCNWAGPIRATLGASAEAPVVEAPIASALGV